MRRRCFSPEPPLFPAGRRWLPLLERLVDEDDVIPELSDAVPWNVEILAASEQAEKRHGPKTMMPFTVPSGTCMSRSPTKPSREPSQRLMTSLRRSMENLHSIALTPLQSMRRAACPILSFPGTFRPAE